MKRGKAIIKQMTGSLLLLTLLVSCLSAGASGETPENEKTAENELEIVRQDDFEEYELGQIYNGTAFLPLSGENKEQGVPSKDGSHWLRSAAVDGKGGFSFSLSKNVQGNLVEVAGRDGSPTQALQILRPEKVAVTAAALTLQPPGAVETARFRYSVDIKNSGKAGIEGEAGYTNNVNNCFGSLSLCGVTLDFNDKSILFEGDAAARPPVSEERISWTLPDNGTWFNFTVDIDALKDTISVYINDKLIGSKQYGQKFTSISAKMLEISAKPSSDGENAIYFDNITIEKSAITADGLARILAEDAFEPLGTDALVCYPGCGRVYFGEEVETFDPNQTSVAPFSEGEQVYLPLRYVAERYGFEVEWHPQHKTVGLTGKENIILTVDSASYRLNCKTEATLGNAVRMAEGVSYLELNDAALLFDKVAYLDETGLAMLVNNESNVPQGSWKAECIETIMGLYPEASLGFEIDGGWYTMADLIEASGATYDELCVTSGAAGKNNQNTTYEIERYGISRSTEQVKSGKFSGKWENHPFYPTVMATEVPSDWSSYNMLSFWLYSEVDTGEHITVGAVSNPDLSYSEYANDQFSVNFYHFGIDIDFTGWKKFELPLSMFQANTKDVQGWQKIDGLYFYTRAFNYEPSPYTTLYIDDVKLETAPEEKRSASEASWNELRAQQEAERTAPKDYVVSVPDIFKDVDVLDYSLLLEAKKNIAEGVDTAKAQNELNRIYEKYQISGDSYSYGDLVVSGVSKLGSSVVSLDKYRYNHEFPEIKNQIPEKTGGIVSQAYFKLGRAMYGWDPKFVPMYTTTWDDFKFNVYANRMLQAPDSTGKWHLYDWSLQIQNYLESTFDYPQYAIEDSSFYDEVQLRFDNDGDAYMLLTVRLFNAEGASAGLVGILAHSKDKMKTWSYYRLPRPFVKFEVLEGNNAECMERPPVILLHNYWSGSDKRGSFVIPEKQADGTLVIPEETIYCEEPCIATAQHSGKSNFCVTADGKIFFSYGVQPTEIQSPEAEAAARSRIPAGHQMHSLYANELSSYTSMVGVPTYVRSYDIATKQFSEPIYVGHAGGHYYDNHNWSSISVDDEGYLHVILIGHNFPLLYRKSSKPFDCTQWEPIEVVSSGISYASLNVDKDGNVYSLGSMLQPRLLLRCCNKQKAKGRGLGGNPCISELARIL